MTFAFHLYDTVNKDIPKKDLSVENKEHFIKVVKELDQEQINIIFILIKKYQLEEDKTDDDLPYGGILENNNIKFIFTNFPIKLRHIIYNFIKLHLKSTDK